MATLASALSLAGDVRAGRRRATDLAEEALAAIAAADGRVNSFTKVLADRARRDAAAVDGAVEVGLDPGPLAGVPFAVKNLFDVAGETTIAGSRIYAGRPPATADAEAVRRLARAGAVLVGTLNMDEFAYGFTTENTHYGPCRNPHDLDRVAGGSSGGSGAAVGAGLVPLTLGSDTNGSVRVPAALCGVFGLKPTYGRVSRRGAALFSASLDHVGALGTTTADLATAFDVLAGWDADDPVSRPEPFEPTTAVLDRGVDGLRIGVLGGHFAAGGWPEVFAAVERVADALDATRRYELPEATRARAAAIVITAAEGAQLHRADLRSSAADFDPMTRDRFLAGALVPASAYVGAQRFRRWYQREARRLFDTVDVLLAPATPFPAPCIGQREAEVDGRTVLTQPYLGAYTQPLSFIGLPVVAVPVTTGGRLPMGVQVVAAPYAEAHALRVAAHLEALGVVQARRGEMPWT